MARFTVYMPDPLRERARDAGLNLSEILRKGVIVALREREATGDTEGGAPAASSSN